MLSNDELTMIQENASSATSDQSIVMRRDCIKALQGVMLKLMDLICDEFKNEEKLPEDCLRYQRSLGTKQGIAKAIEAVRIQCDEEKEYETMKWREQIQPIIDAVVKQHGIKDDKALRKALLAARPDYVRTTSHMSKIWREEVKRSIAEATAAIPSA